MMYRVYVADNYRWADEELAPVAESFSSYNAAVVKCKEIVDEWFADEIASNRPLSELAIHYQAFGPDPFVVPRAEGVPAFSSRQYAEQACNRIEKGVK